MDVTSAEFTRFSNLFFATDEKLRERAVTKSTAK